MGYPYGMIKDPDGRGPAYVWHRASSETASECWIATPRLITPGELRVRIEMWKGSQWVNDHWGDVLDLMAVALLHTRGDIAYENGQAKGIFAINSGVWGLASQPLAPGDPRVDVELYRQLIGGVLPDAATVQSDWWLTLMGQLYFPAGSQMYDWPSPFSVLEDNCRLGAGIMAPLSLTYGPMTPSEQRRATGAEVVFVDTESGRPFPPTSAASGPPDSAVQDVFWSSILRGTVMAMAWWWPTETKRVLAQAAGMSTTGNRVTFQTITSALGMSGNVQMTAWFANAFSRLRQAVLADATSWLPPAYLSHYFEAQRADDAWLEHQGDRAAKTADEMFGPVGDTATAVVEGAKTTWWILVGAVALAVVLFGWRKGGPAPSGGGGAS